MPKRRTRPAVAEALVKGALAGVVGGAAMLVAETLADRRLLSRSGSARQEWRRLAGNVASRRLRAASRRQKQLAGVGMHLAYSAFLGAIYGVAKGRTNLSGPLQLFLRDGLMYAAYLSTRGFAPRRRPARLARGGTKRGLLPVTADAVFATATAISFKALANGRRR